MLKLIDSKTQTVELYIIKPQSYSSGTQKEKMQHNRVEMIEYD